MASVDLGQFPARKLDNHAHRIRPLDSRVAHFNQLTLLRPETGYYAARKRVTGPIEQSSSPKRAASLRFIVCLGIVSLFADMTYEGAHSIIGPYLKDLGATALQVALIAGLGEMLGASLRFFSGRFADRSRAYWTITFSGYAMNVIAVPALAFASNWQLAAILIIAERTGKALRGPARDVLLSGATENIGHGWGFGLHSIMDQTGAVIGPYAAGDIWLRLRPGRITSAPGFWLAGVPGCPRHDDRIGSRAPSEPRTCQTGEDAIHYGASQSLLDLRGCCWVGGLACGMVDFPLLAYHFQSANIATQVEIPLLYTRARWR